MKIFIVPYVATKVFMRTFLIDAEGVVLDMPLLLNVFYIVPFCNLISCNTFFYRFLKFFYVNEINAQREKINWTPSCAQHN